MGVAFSLLYRSLILISILFRTWSLRSLSDSLMSTVLLALTVFLGYIVAYHTYGRWLARRIFNIDPDALVPSRELRDDVDFIPTRKEVIFGHHFTSIAGTGPIVGPAIAVFWGWLPALLWVVFGSIFIGAVHDFSALVVSLRNRGQTVGEVAGRLITARTKFLFLSILALALTVVLAIFGLVIATIMHLYPESVLSIWIVVPVAFAVGYWVYRSGGGLLVPSLVALGIIYLAIWLGVYHVHVDWSGGLVSLANWLGLPEGFATPVVMWTFILLIYCFVASVLPVWVLLQPRDFVNSHQLLVALALLLGGLLVAGLTGDADLFASAPAVAKDIPADAPPIWPFLFITISCGAVSGFHCLVSSGTSSKQVATENDAQYVGYGAMLLEGALATIVILACCAGVGMGAFHKEAVGSDGAYRYVPTLENGVQKTGRDAWLARYSPQTKWSEFGLGPTVRAVVEGGANFMKMVGVPLELGIGVVAALVATFAATTLDTATRLQRYVIQELSGALRIAPFTNRYLATALAVALGGGVALFAGPTPGLGGRILWPLFGATNQLLAGLAFMVTVFYLWRRNKPILFALLPMLLMLIMPAWAMIWNMFNPESGWLQTKNYLLLGFGLGITVLQIWMMAEATLMWPKAKGILEQPLPPLSDVIRRRAVGAAQASTTAS